MSYVDTVAYVHMNINFVNKDVGVIQKFTAHVISLLSNHYNNTLQYYIICHSTDSQRSMSLHSIHYHTNFSLLVNFIMNGRICQVRTTPMMNLIKILYIVLYSLPLKEREDQSLDNLKAES